MSEGTPEPVSVGAQLTAALDERDGLRAQIAEMLRTYEDPHHSGYWTSRVRERTLRKWQAADAADAGTGEVAQAKLEEIREGLA